MKPKTKQMTITKSDLPKGAFAFEKIEDANRSVDYKQGNPYYYGRVGGDQVIHLGPNDTIQGTFHHNVTTVCLDAYLAWIKENCIWHKTTITYHEPKRAVLTDLDVSRAPVEVTEAWVNSVVLRKMTDRQKQDLAKVKAAKEARVAKQKAETKKRAAEERALRAKEKKANAIHDEYGDLASALHILKKHGLKVVTVDEPRSKKK